MPTIKSLPEFSDWLAGLKDKSHRGVIVARVKRLGAGLLGDVRPVGEGVSEMRIHVGPGFRVYFVQRGQELVDPALRWRQELAGARHRTREGTGPAS